MKRIIRAVIAATTVAVLAMSMVGCNSKGKVAATVNGTDIYENDVTTYVDQLRTYYSVTDDADWATFLSQYGYEPSDIRDLAIDALAQEQLVADKADELGITVSDDDVNSQITTLRETYGYTDDDTWTSALESAGYDSEDDYKAAMKSSLLQEAVLEQEVPTTTPTDDAIVSAASSYAGSRASGIMVADEATANSLADQINASSDKAATFKELFAANNTDTTYVGTDGDLGWTSTNYMNYYYYLSNVGTAVTDMAKGDVTVVAPSSSTSSSGSTTSTGYWVIYCTDVFEVTDSSTLTVSQIPSDLLETITSSVQNSTWQTDCSTYLQSLLDDADVQKNDMPEGLSYDVDMSLATSTDSSSTDSTSTTTDSSSTSSSTSTDSSSTSSSTSTDSSSTSSTSSAS